MARLRKVTISKKVKRAARRGGLEIDNRGHLRRDTGTDNIQPKTPISVEPAQKITIPQVVPVRKLAELLGQTTSAIVSKLFANGVSATINESVDFDTAAIIADEFNFVAQKEKSAVKKVTGDNAGKEMKISRPPVIAVMGHVDHGKTTLLDAIRQTNVVASESGGITQHIGAYRVEIRLPDESKSRLPDRSSPRRTKAGESPTGANRGISKGKAKKRYLTFLDTPGHEAFSTMRAQGANITDVVILVVAADDGVKPQTLEAISHARSAGVPVIVAINKIDVPGADPERVKRELAEHNLVPEDWGGKTPMVAVSAKQNKNIDSLLEIVSLTADLEGLKTNPNLAGAGIVIESKVRPGLGPVATVLVQNGTIHRGADIVISDQSGRIKTMENDRGERIDTATASVPVQISGLKHVVPVGSTVTEVKDDKEAKDLILSAQQSSSTKSAISGGLGKVAQAIKGGKIKELDIILKADVQGSLDAIKSSLAEIKSDEVKVKFISGGIGPVSESDVNLAVSSGAVILAFGVSVPPAVKKLADKFDIKISRYDVIYELIDEVKAALQGLLEPETVTTEMGTLKVLKIFRRTQDDGIVGGLVTKGQLRAGVKFRARRGEELLGEGIIESLQIGPGKVDVARQNDECGISYKGQFKFKPDDIIEAYHQEEILKVIK